MQLSLTTRNLKSWSSKTLPSEGVDRGYLEINRGTEKNPDLWRYRDLRDIKVGDREITGLVSQEEVEPKNGSLSKTQQPSGKVRFRVNKSTEIDIAIRELFGTHGVKYEWLRPGFFSNLRPHVDDHCHLYRRAYFHF